VAHDTVMNHSTLALDYLPLFGRFFLPSGMSDGCRFGFMGCPDLFFAQDSQEWPFDIISRMHAC
jgi:hypothetical protein